MTQGNPDRAAFAVSAMLIIFCSLLPLCVCGPIFVNLGYDKLEQKGPLPFRPIVFLMSLSGLISMVLGAGACICACNRIKWRKHFERIELVIYMALLLLSIGNLVTVVVLGILMGQQQGWLFLSYDPQTGETSSSTRACLQAQVAFNCMNVVVHFWAIYRFIPMGPPPKPKNEDSAPSATTATKSKDVTPPAPAHVHLKLARLSTDTESVRTVSTTVSWDKEQPAGWDARSFV